MASAASTPVFACCKATERLNASSAVGDFLPFTTYISLQHNFKAMAPSLLDPEPAAQVTSKDFETAPVATSVDQHEEHQYLDLIREILETGEHRPDR